MIICELCEIYKKEQVIYFKYIIVYSNFIHTSFFFAQLVRYHILLTKVGKAKFVET